MNELILPLLVPFVTALVLALLRGHHALERVLAILSTGGLALFAAWLLVTVDRSGPAAMFVGGWPAPYGIVFVADRLSALFLFVSLAVATAVLVYSLFSLDELRQNHFFHPFFQFTLLGVNWAFLTGDLFNLFVAYEVMLIGSYGAMSVGGTRDQVRETMKYLAINSIGSACFVIGIGLVYATTSALNMADIAVRSQELAGPQAAVLTAGSMFLLIVFLMKAAAFPVTFWLPDSYPVVPPGVIGYFGGLLTKVGVYSLLRVFVLVLRQPGHELALEILLFLSGLTMFLGVVGAMCQWEMRRLLSWHIISQVGYMIMGIGMAVTGRVAELALAGTILHVVHNMLVKSSLFLVGGILERIAGSQRLLKLGGLLDAAPWAAATFLLAALSLAGIPPFSGFLSKVVLLQAGVAGNHWVVVSVSVLTSFLTLYSMAKIWTWAFWRGDPGELPRSRAPWPMLPPVLALVLLSVAIGVGATPALRFAGGAARDLLDSTAYVNAVFPDRHPVLAAVEEAP
ncbi:MAG TPA: proton-conducting transporter membrane subunit [Candidatus Limnocylindrales bacterium]|nr:proton-conducting transporter membrane subunit [Candidatus Limnocylindrales bacterium]